MKLILRQHAPKWLQFKFSRQAAYVGVKIGRDAGSLRWIPALVKYTSRVKAVNAIPLGSGIRAHAYNTRCLPALSYLSQLDNIPSYGAKEEQRVLSSMFKVPYNCLRVGDFFYLSEFNLRCPKSFLAYSSSCMLRAAHQTLNWKSLCLELLQSFHVTSADLTFTDCRNNLQITDELRFPSWWDFNLWNGYHGFPLSSGLSKIHRNTALICQAGIPDFVRSLASRACLYGRWNGEFNLRQGTLFSTFAPNEGIVTLNYTKKKNYRTCDSLSPAIREECIDTFSTLLQSHFPRLQRIFYWLTTRVLYPSSIIATLRTRLMAICNVNIPIDHITSVQKLLAHCNCPTITTEWVRSAANAWLTENRFYDERIPQTCVYGCAFHKPGFSAYTSVVDPVSSSPDESGGASDSSSSCSSSSSSSSASSDNSVSPAHIRVTRKKLSNPPHAVGDCLKHYLSCSIIRRITNEAFKGCLGKDTFALWQRYSKFIQSKKRHVTLLRMGLARDSIQFIHIIRLAIASRCYRRTRKDTDIYI